MAEAAATIQAVTLRRARPADNARIAAIWNHEVMWTTATMDTEPRGPAAQRRWLAAHDDAHPVVVAVDDVLAYGSLSPYRDRPAFTSTVADSVYVRADRRGAGLGSSVVAELLRLARALGHHTVIASISADQAASLALHQAFGFVEKGRLAELGHKLGRWVDVLYLQRMEIGRAHV